MLKKLLFSNLKLLNHANLVIIDGQQKHVFGSNRESLKAEITVEDQAFYKYIVFGGSIGASEAYMNGYWSSPNLTNVIRIFAVNQQLTEKLETKFNFFIKPLFKLIHYLNKNSIKNSQKNISAHYDLSNDFFKLFLDETMMYSSAIFKNKSQSLHHASLNKLDIICKKLQLKSTDHIIEIGTGWGGFAIYAAEKYGCRVTTTTISRQQYSFAKELIKKKGLTKQINLLFKDYRHLSGQFDKLVSIEMIEAVGHHYYPEYFKQVSSLLKPTGMGLIQAITIRDQRYNEAVKTVDFIQKYIFPGSCIPSIDIIQSTITRHTDLIISDLENINVHYAKTLTLWQKSFNKNSKKIMSLGFDERFMKMWNYYFSYCAGGFQERAINDFHILLSKPLNRLPQNEKDLL